MAKGNDGNYLQHSIETKLAILLKAFDAKNRLHIALAHGMAPFEICEKPSAGQTSKLLHRALDLSMKPEEPEESPLVTAYRKTSASLHHYPNSSELISAIVGRHRLSGGITEINESKCAELKAKWQNTNVMPHCASWRKEIRNGGILSKPTELKTAWLFSMDPMTYSEHHYSDDNKLHKEDKENLIALLTAFGESRQPGIATIFVYSVKPPIRPLFWDFVDEIADQSGMATTSCWLTHQGGNRNLAALLCSNIYLPKDWVPFGIEIGR